MSFTDYDTCVTVVVDAGELGSHDIDVETTVSIDDEWIAQEAFDQELYTDDQRESIAKGWLEDQDEASLLELFADLCNIDI